MGPAQIATAEGEAAPGRSAFLDRQANTWRDFHESASLWKLVGTLSWLDIKTRYRGSILGPLWVTLSTGVMIGALGIVYSELFNQDMHDYLPYLAASLVLWGALSGLVADACATFTAAESMIRSARMPFTVHVWRIVVRNAILFLHNVVIVLAVFSYYALWPGATALLALPGLALWIVDWVAVCMLLGSICARFRDVPQIVGSVIQIAFYATPVIWKPEQLHEHAHLVVYNPFFCMIEIARAPMFGDIPMAGAWTGALVSSVVLWAVAWLLFSRVRGRLAFWV